jgi:hypothetical protein
VRRFFASIAAQDRGGSAPDNVVMPGMPCATARPRIFASSVRGPLPDGVLMTKFHLAVLQVVGDVRATFGHLRRRALRARRCAPAPSTCRRSKGCAARARPGARRARRFRACRNLSPKGIRGLRAAGDRRTLRGPSRRRRPMFGSSPVAFTCRPHFRAEDQRLHPALQER